MTPAEARSNPAGGRSTDSTGSPEGAPAQPLRKRAEALAGESSGEMPQNPEELSPEAARRALHELRVHQLELEMQNEELRRAQEELEVSRERYFDLYDLAPVGYLTLSEQGLILEANLTAAKLLGVARGALVKHPLSRFVLPEDQDIHFLHRRQLLATGEPQSWELRLLRKDAAPFWVRVEATTAPDADGVSAWRAVVSDISESKRAERAIQTINGELQDFAFALAHDLREPLRTVVVFNQLLAEELSGKLGEDADKYLSFSIEGAMRMDALMNGLIEYWGVTEGAVARSSAVDCNEALAQALSSLHVSIQESGAKITADPLPAVTAKESMLTQLFQNLISNSIKYRSKATPTIHISAARIREGWLFSVTDNGLGIDPAYAERVFGIFKRLHGREIPGTGIGLALCRKVVERHGGRIWVESEAGQGSVFKFTIPMNGQP
jgi:PAS domain S-box-containing protein